MSDKSFLDRTLECIEAQFEEEVQRRLENQTNVDIVVHPTVFPVIFQESNGYSTGTIHRVAVVDDFDIWSTADHVTEDRDFSQLIEIYGDCYRLETIGQYDVHFFCQSRQALEKWKNSCPSPDQAGSLIGFTKSTYNLEDLPLVAMAIGYPYGVLDGNPQLRYLVPFTSSQSNDLSSLLWLQSLEGPVVGGMSGGKISLMNSSDSVGVLVATSYFDPLREKNPKHYAAIQMFHNEMKLLVT